MTTEHILLAVTGLSPQVVTETIYALHKANKPLPNRVVIITTARGAQEVNTHLLQEGHLAKLCADYQLPPITLAESDILIVPDANGRPIDDASSIEDHTALSNYITNTVRELTANPHTSIHASLAGGRKTMTFFLGYAMSLYGRKQDSLSHILVTEGFESSQFFYPTPYPHQIYLRNGSRDAQDAEVTLANIPFVRLREEFPEKLLNGSANYSETVECLNIDLTKEQLTFDHKKREITFAGQQCYMPPADYGFYLWFCYRAKQALSGLTIPHQSEPEVGYADEFLSVYAQVIDQFKQEQLEEKVFSKGMEKRYFEERKTAVNTHIKNQFGKRIGQFLWINQLGRINKRTHFAVTIPPQQIQITL